ncbi:MAG: SPFH/Band 7/PHB domain protein [Labilithrix sp.]|nr:SPFH/Band 7/PHB domain protein [Labilithrix sp.]MCW5816246.1 SPFH/Band 7/PHB domain protein [Labilithrix sp.]
MNPDTLQLLVGVAIGISVFPLIALLVRATTVAVEDEEAVLVTEFGKLVETYTEPGLHFFPAKVFPWTTLTHVSLRRDFRRFDAVHVNDARGTTVVVDLWLELRVSDAAKAIFSVTDWDHALQNLVSHATTSILGGREFHEILSDRTELGELLAKDIAAETDAWGVTIERVFIRNVSLLPEVSRQMFETISARLERAKADIDEKGRLDAAQLEAETHKRVAALVAEAKGQYPAAVGRALATLRPGSKLFDAYNELYELSLVRPHRTISFRGFKEEVRAVDAAMLPLEGQLPARADTLLKR